MFVLVVIFLVPFSATVLCDNCVLICILVVTQNMKNIGRPGYYTLLTQFIAGFTAFASFNRQQIVQCTEGFA